MLFAVHITVVVVVVDLPYFLRFTLALLPDISVYEDTLLHRLELPIEALEEDDAEAGIFGSRGGSDGVHRQLRNLCVVSTCFHSLFHSSFTLSLCQALSPRLSRSLSLFPQTSDYARSGAEGRSMIEDDRESGRRMGQTYTYIDRSDARP